MKVILLSAGQGKRLLPLTENQPKCALPLGDKTALEWQLESLAAAGASEVVVATGFQAGLVRQIVHRFKRLPVRIAHNPFFAHCDNLGTCWIVRHEMTDPFVLINGDTMFEPEVFRRLIASRDSHDITLVTNEKDDYDDDDMKVTVKNRSLKRVDKQLPIAEVDGESIGMIRFRGTGVGLFRTQLESMMLEESTLKRWYLSAIDLLARQG
ncbi:MAG: NTP transferase domain-containing protein, partial [Gammaproteobacteria bacterium]|nr:NTP transferase domain-containing protein [Gammaproteobacteria bacterium]